MANEVDLEFRDGVAYVTFRRPQNGNSIDNGFGRAFREAALTIEANATARAVLMTGEGKHFCFGGDLKAIFASGEGARAYVTALTADLHAGMSLFARMDAPVIVAVNGIAAGAGLGLVLGADLAVAANNAQFVAAYSSVGLTPDATCTFWLPRAVGTKRAKDLLMTNRILSADEALEWGLVNQVVEANELLQAAGALAERLSAGPKSAFGALKRLMADSESGLDAQLGRESSSIAARVASVEGREGIAAFLEKRGPRYE